MIVLEIPRHERVVMVDSQHKHTRILTGTRLTVEHVHPVDPANPEHIDHAERR